MLYRPWPDTDEDEKMEEGLKEDPEGLVCRLVKKGAAEVIKATLMKQGIQEPDANALLTLLA